MISIMSIKSIKSLFHNENNISPRSKFTQINTSLSDNLSVMKCKGSAK